MIKVSAATKRYDGKTVVENMSFDVAAGRVTGFVGPNGAGKSTTMRMMVGLTKPDSGEVTYAGLRYEELAQPAHVVGSVLDARSMHPGRTAANHLRALAALGSVPPERVGAVLQTVGLESAANQRAGKFSLGMRQRLALAGALLGQPDVLLLDEPANGLDPDGIRWLRNYLRKFADRGGTVFVSSHLISELAMFADDLVVIGAGKLLAADSLDAIIATNETAVAVETPHPEEFASVLTNDGLQFDTHGEQFVVHRTTSTHVSQVAFDHRIRLVEITQTTKSLEDTLLEMTNDSAEFASA